MSAPGDAESGGLIAGSPLKGRMRHAVGVRWSTAQISCHGFRWYSGHGSRPTAHNNSSPAMAFVGIPGTVLGPRHIPSHSCYCDSCHRSVFAEEKTKAIHIHIYTHIYIHIYARDLVIGGCLFFVCAPRLRCRRLFFSLCVCPQASLPSMAARSA